jgi:hypothetical protein
MKIRSKIDYHFRLLLQRPLGYNSISFIMANFAIDYSNKLTTMQFKNISKAI